MLIIRHPRNFSRHLCASTGVCSLLLLITHSDCYALPAPAICPYYSHIARLRRPFYAHNKAPPKLFKAPLCKHRCMFLATTYNSLRLLRASRSRNLSLLFAYRATSSPFYAHNKAPPKLFKAPLCKHRCLESSGGW